MKKLLILILALCLPSFATTTASGNVKDLTGTAITSKTKVRFALQNCNSPKVNGTAIVPKLYYEPSLDGSGAFSFSLYANSEITCSSGSSSGGSYLVTISYAGGEPWTNTYCITGVFNLNSATPCTTEPLVTSPTGDTTYVRRDGGNTMAGHLVPNVDNTYNLGSASSYFATAFLNAVRAEQTNAPTCVANYGFIWYDTSNVWKFCANGGGATQFGTGTVTSVGFSTDATWMTVGSSPVTGAGTITYNRTTGLTANQVLATPNGSTGTVGLRALVVADVPANVANRTACYVAGGDNASAALADADDQNDYWINDTGGTMRVTRVWVQSDAGTPIINIQRDDGTAANILTSNLTAATGNGACADSSGGSMSVRGGSITCTNSISATERDLAVGHALNFVMVTAGGTAKRATVCVQLTPQ